MRWCGVRFAVMRLEMIVHELICLLWNGDEQHGACRNLWPAWGAAAGFGNMFCLFNSSGIQVCIAAACRYFLLRKSILSRLVDKDGMGGWM